MIYNIIWTYFHVFMGDSFLVWIRWFIISKSKKYGRHYGIFYPYISKRKEIPAWSGRQVRNFSMRYLLIWDRRHDEMVCCRADVLLREFGLFLICHRIEKNCWLEFLLATIWYGLMVFCSLRWASKNDNRNRWWWFLSVVPQSIST